MSGRVKYIPEIVLDLDTLSNMQFRDLPRLHDVVLLLAILLEETIFVTSEIDVAINSRNSGGPAFNDKGECISIAFQSLKLEDTENIGYVILTPIIMHFIQHYEKNGEYLGFPILGVEWQKMENLDPRMSMGIGNEHKEPTTPESNVLNPSDVILSFDGVNVANDGTCMFVFSMQKT
uniref:PDZ domain-containing protein n=1 Tax=Lactuca sativa TaxID=4236 RepID=A0A9R1UTC0_LACSA|nr:hypothetical protein LSAT_V11C800419090 [Lactuca sativa]